jgi:uncharacterized Fe-S cluster protein YjdI
MDKKDLVKHYANDEIIVVWQSGKCSHSANCVKHLAKVFQPKSSPWVQMENGTSEEIVAAVKQCPSGALTIKYSADS